ncbi:Putative NTF2-like domain superfamily protein [Septoria linicola]|uniref:NTF2-like domain superfamily protein n=1 Tax=Septoria linicola TaxID=215465 RepID=A0A9Q9ANT7_9PEZI|nr:putative NTF2-like domain superfamily protein [Septoria linicola]USW49810.1 Putative NTF2-like domain superfamily protein [Septoria linicola]
MKSFSFLTTACLLGLAHSVDDSLYAPGPGVEPAFRAYLNELYAQAEDPASTSTFTDFFTSDGKLIVRGTTAVGATDILALKRQLLPTAGNKHWNHVQNVTTVDSDTDAQKVYKVLGVLETTYDGGNCSRAYYSSRFTVVKGAGGVLDLTPRVGNLAAYDDFIIEPLSSPTDIPCE